jgi:hypothetical protein
MTTIPASLVSMMLDGAARAAQLLPLAFSLNVMQPAAAQLPRLEPVPVVADSEAPAASTVAVFDATTGRLLPLAARHVAVEVHGVHALVHTLLTYRNDGAEPIHALFRVPLPAVVTGPLDFVAVLPDDEDGAGCGDTDPKTAELIEAGEDLAQFEHGSLLLAPGEEITVTLTRPAPVLVREQRHRLVLSLVADAEQDRAARFSAEVLVHAQQPIRALASATHGGTASGLGALTAGLRIPEGRTVASRFLSVDYELDATGAVAALTTAAAPDRPSALPGAAVDVAFVTR